MSLDRIMYRAYIYSIDALKIFVLLPMNAIFSFVVRLWWRVSGIQALIERNYLDPSCYAHSAQILQCWGKIRISTMPSLGRRNFILTHHGFCHPSCVLRDDVTLMDVNDREAIFVERDHKSEPATRSSYVALAWGQITTAKRVVILPKSSFLKLADELLEKGLPRVVFMHNHARCGSTMLCNMFEHTDRVLCVCEPEALTAAFKITSNDTDTEGRTRMLHAVVAMLTKPIRGERGEKPLAYVIKPRVFLAERMDVLQQAFPTCVHLFLYRNPVLSCRSLYRMMFSGLVLYLTMAVIDHGSRTVKEKLTQASGPAKFCLSNKLTSHSFLEYSFLRTLDRFLIYIGCVAEGMEITGLCYDDLCKHPDFMLKRIFQLCNLPQSLVQKAQRAMEHDAQVDSSVGRQQLARVSGPAPEFSQEFLESMVKICKDHDLDVTGGWASLRLPGSILFPISS